MDRAVDLLQEVADERMVRSRGEPPVDQKARTQVRIAAGPVRSLRQMQRVARWSQAVDKGRTKF